MSPPREVRYPLPQPQAAPLPIPNSEKPAQPPNRHDQETLRAAGPVVPAPVVIPKATIKLGSAPPNIASGSTFTTTAQIANIGTVAIPKDVTLRITSPLYLSQKLTCTPFKSVCT